MNQTQKRYAIDRVNQIVRDKEKSLREKFTTKKVELSRQEKVTKIRKGQVKIFSDKNITYNKCSFYLTDVFDFSPFEKQGGVDKKKYDDTMSPVRKKAQEVKDKIMLGDADEALKMIEQLEAM